MRRSSTVALSRADLITKKKMFREDYVIGNPIRDVGVGKNGERRLCKHKVSNAIKEVKCIRKYSMSETELTRFKDQL